MEKEDLKKFVKDKYSEIANTSDNCCCSTSCCGNTTETRTKQIGYSVEDLEKVPRESVKGLGCGNPVNYLELEEGEKILDLGSGLGIDVFLASKKVGPQGQAVGIDASEEMIRKATEIAKRDGYENVEFKHGEIEKLPFQDKSFDAVTSNCVINLSTDKLKTYKEIYRILKPNGRILISDIVTSEELPEEIRNDPEAWAACIGGAVEKEEYLNIIEKAGFEKIEIVSESVFDSDVDLSAEILSLQVRAVK
ncbi:arsenite S-adenosylmethyltransferase [candidate division MSBL1 archaeon SCGC-AAA382A13]|uniref:Arsenite methyltransferase n=1 Tax=candidate division MSBL1 archaeon SCGC-AAA382A13 TaxID=1698279 RepID=A0A133VFZ3_9EURY|nr:arsenite S-adenosylmethyltransferase [candidate division MSBL1 archaeon SCGC-AAA382A13]